MNKKYVLLNRKAGKYISREPIIQPARLQTKPHSWIKNDTLYTRHCYNLDGEIAEIETDIFTGQIYAFVKNKKCIIPISESCIKEK